MPGSSEILRFVFCGLTRPCHAATPFLQYAPIQLQLAGVVAPNTDRHHAVVHGAKRGGGRLGSDMRCVQWCCLE